MSAIFLSHDHADVSMARRVASELSAAGYEVWWDDELPVHRAFYDVIEERLRAAPAVIVLWSGSASRSQWVRAEADLARTLGTLVQVTLDGNPPPMPFNQIQYAKLDSRADITGNREWQRVLDSVDALADSDRQNVDRPLRTPPRPKKRPWYALLIVAALVIVGLPVAVYLFSTHDVVEDRKPVAESPLVAAVPFEPLGRDPKAIDFAAALADAVAGSLGENSVRTIPVRQTDTFVGSGRVSALVDVGADFALGGTVRSAGGRLRVRATLEEVSSRVIIWSAQFDRPFDRERLLLSEVASAVTETAYTVAEALEQPGMELNAQTLSMYLKGTEQLKSGAPTGLERVVTLMEQVVAAAPDFAHAHGILALVLVNGRTPPERVGAVWMRARREAETAIALYPPAGAAYDALYFLARYEAPTNLHLAETQLREGLRQAPRYPFLPMRLCEFLMDVGRVGESLVHCEQAVALRPLAAPLAYRRALANWFAGQPHLAFRLMDEAWQQNPMHDWMTAHRFMMMVFGGRSRDAALVLGDAEQRPTLLTPDDVSAFERFLEVQAVGVPADIDAVLKGAVASRYSGRLSSQAFRILMAGYLGRVDAALDLLARLDPEALVGMMLLFHPVLDSVRRDPRFMRIVSRSGHVTYWRQTGIWPDFCSDRTLPYDCKVEAAKVASTR